MLRLERKGEVLDRVRSTWCTSHRSFFVRFFWIKKVRAGEWRHVFIIGVLVCLWLVCLLCLLWIKKTRDTEKTYIWVSVWWKTKNYEEGIYTSLRNWVGRGTGTPKDKDKVNRRKVCECKGCLLFFVVYYKRVNWELKRVLLKIIYLLWINKAKAKDKIYMWLSVLWKTTN
jgi:hypothetical protein